MDILQAYSGAKERGESLTDAVRGYLLWRVLHGRPESPTGEDDVDVRTYLMQLRTRSIGAEILRLHTDALESFYSWAKSSGRIASSPFEDYDFHQPYLSRDQIRRRRSALTKDGEDSQLAHLKGLNRLAEALNSASDVRTAFDLTLEVLAETIDLKTAWAFVTTESGLLPLGPAEEAPHGFVLAAWRGLPPGLQGDNRAFLSRPPACHCQTLLHADQLLRAVNIVECSRLQDSADHAGDNQGLRFHASTPILAGDGLLGIINVATEEWQFLSAEDLSFLSAAGAQVAVTLERARLFDEVETQRDRMRTELQMARSIQASLLPKGPPKITGCEVAAEWRSAEHVAGDFYDWFRLPDGRWALIMGDVTDKGAPAALYMSMVRSLIRTMALLATDPADLLCRVNTELARHASTGMFVTVFCAFLDSDANALHYANAGHNPPVLARSNGSLERLTPTGPLLGVMDTVELSSRRVSLQTHDVLMVYTDGLTDALSAQGRTFDLDTSLSKLPITSTDASGLLRRLMTDLDDFTAGAPQRDDITVWVLCRT
jgi:serine phosphatase RsbU (regulator of sigma subunit)